MIILLLKSYVKGYVRKDGVYVRAHSTKQTAAKDAGQQSLWDEDEPRPLPPNRFKGHDPVKATPDLFEGHQEVNAPAIKPSKAFGSIGGLAKRAYDSLSPQAKNAVDGWNMNWTSGELERAFRNGGSLADEIHEAFRPVRNKLRSIYGDTIPLYRGEKHSPEASGDERKLFSWSPVKELADSFASNGHTTKKYGATEAEIMRAVETYNKTGFVTFRGRKYKRNKEMPDYYDIYNKHNHIITDGDNLEKELRDDQKYRDEMVAEGKAKGQTYRADVPINSLVWVPVGANLSQPEFIAMYNPRKQASSLMAKAMVLIMVRK